MFSKNRLLSVDHLYEIIDSIALTVANNTDGPELDNFNADVSRTKEFIAERMLNVRNQCVEESASGQLKVFPNPATTYVTICLPHSKLSGVQIQIVNFLGQLVQSTKVDYIPGNVYILKTEHIPSGQYIIVVKTEGENLSEKEQAQFTLFGLNGLLIMIIIRTKFFLVFFENAKDWSKIPPSNFLPEFKITKFTIIQFLV